MSAVTNPITTARSQCTAHLLFVLPLSTLRRVPASRGYESVPFRAEEPAIPSILLIRHAQASFGAADYDVLSDRGHEQTRALVAGLERRGVAAQRVISGGLRRQRDTAGPCAQACGVELEVDERFDEYHDRDIFGHHSSVAAGLERHAGDRELTSRDFQVLLNDALAGWIAAGADGPAEETWAAFEGRLTAAVRPLAAGLGKGETALVISSGGSISAIAAAVLGVPPETMIALNHASVNTGITKLAVGRGGVTLVSWNEHAHLDEAGASLITYR